MRIFLFILITTLYFSPYASFPLLAAGKTPPMERIMYYMDTDSGYESLKKNASRIDVLSPQWFTFDAAGNVTADISSRAAQVIEKHPKMKVMPLVSNQHFDLTVAHVVLTDATVQDKIIDELIKIGKQNKYWGYQIDMEHMDASDRELYTAFSRKVSNALHNEGMIYSVAVVSKVSDDPKDYSVKAWTKWAGVFDYKALGETADFITIMLYDQDDSVGPVSTLSWYTEVIAYAKTLIPKEKLSIGIPFYGWEWNPKTGKKVASHTYRYVTDQIKKKTVQSTMFNEVLGNGIMTYTVKINGAKEKRVLWYENIESFKLKYNIIKKEGLRGFSAWALGQEDPRIWTLLAVRK